MRDVKVAVTGDMLVDAVRRTIGAQPVAVGIRRTQGPTKHVDAIAVADRPPPSRVLVGAFGLAIDVTLESRN
jgi:hypothetical protein